MDDILDIQTQSNIYAWFFEKLLKFGISDKLAHSINSIVLLILLALLLYVVDYLFRWIVRKVVRKAVKKTKTKFDDYLIKNKVVKYFIHSFITIIARIFLPVIFVGFPKWTDATIKITDIVLTLSIGLFVNGIFKTIRDWLNDKKSFEDKPIDSYMQVISILIIFVCGINIYSVLTGESPTNFLVSLGAASAILMLIFKDTILGFVASIQVSANDMVRLGDWVEMPKYGADGDVMSITLNTVKIRNFDKTITTVPTYAFITDSFKNWRGMSESGGRRIKRSIHLKMSSFKFLQPEDLEQFKKYRLIKNYITEKEQEINQHNQQIEENQVAVNVRRLSNVGVFRTYAEHYLRENNRINQNMTIMVRQLAPTSKGLPIEIYCFTNDVRWIYFEKIMADTFDHLLTIIPEFKLEIFEEPSGTDFSNLVAD